MLVDCLPDGAAAAVSAGVRAIGLLAGATLALSSVNGGLLAAKAAAAWGAPPWLAAMLPVAAVFLLVAAEVHGGLLSCGLCAAVGLPSRLAAALAAFAGCLDVALGRVVPSHTRSARYSLRTWRRVYYREAEAGGSASGALTSWLLQPLRRLFVDKAMSTRWRSSRQEVVAADAADSENDDPTWSPGPGGDDGTASSSSSSSEGRGDAGEEDVTDGGQGAEESGPPLPQWEWLAEEGLSPGEALALQRCPVCLCARSRMALGCGHQVCHTCGAGISRCPLCRRAVSFRLELF
eukprot:SM003755S13602  [mRNA]  locus=s3755:501:1376:- [translate_table: standard]